MHFSRSTFQAAVQSYSSLLQRLIPARILSVFREIYWVLAGRAARKGFSKEVFGSLDCLKCTIGYNIYGGYCVPLSSRHRPAAQHILRGAVFEPRTIEFMIANCGDGDIVHAGTYFGDFLPALSKSCASNAKVWAFEPNRENYRCARITCELNELSNVALRNAGLGASRTNGRMQVIDESGRPLGGGSRIVSKHHHNPSGTEPVEIVTVDDSVDLNRRITIVQLDVEGYEEDALTGALQAIRRWLPILILEAWPHTALFSNDWFVTNILALGYGRKLTVHGNAVFAHGAVIPPQPPGRTPA